MPERDDRWTLTELINFETGIDSAEDFPADVKTRVEAAAAGRDSASARRAGFRVLLGEIPETTAGMRAAGGIRMAEILISATGLALGISGVLGLQDHPRGGISVPLFLAILLVPQWLLLVWLALTFVFRRKSSAGFSVFQHLIGLAARKFSGVPSWWQRLTLEAGPPRRALLWRLARIAQAAGIAFNLGIIAALAALVLTKHISFFWETTTLDAMRTLLSQAVRILSSPWAAVWPGAIPNAGVIGDSRWFPGKSLSPGPGEWWRFLLMAVFFWGLLPRLFLWAVSVWSERRALARLDFQSRPHRALWRRLTNARATIATDPPLDGALVIDIGGIRPDQEKLRPFLLQTLRINPRSWHTTAVMDKGAEADASAAISAAPAGIVLLVEGWSLAPARIRNLHARIRRALGPEKPVRFLVFSDPAAAEEREIWENFVDSLRDPAAEIHFHGADGSPPDHP